MTDNDAAERLRVSAITLGGGLNEKGYAYVLLDDALDALAAERRATVERIREALRRTSLVGIDRGEWGTGWAVPRYELTAILDAEADRD